MKNKFILWLSLLIAFNLIFHSCRTEDMYQENERQKQDLKASVLRFHEISNNTPLIQKVTQLQTELFSSNKLLEKNNSILDGATISTDKVILVENGTQKTYTFPVKRASKSSGLENLVLKQNADGTFSGVLIQYDITPLQKDLFVLGEDVDMKNKIKIFDINNLSISQKVATEAIGCYVITWENGVCGSGQHGYGDDTCQLTGSGAASAPGIISIVNTCSGGAGGTDTGIPPYPNPDSTGGNTGGYGTLPYSDDSDLMLAKYQQFSNIFHINSYGFTSTLRTKLFYLYLYQYEDQYTVSKLLSYFGTKPDILNNAVDMFTENASLSWDDFYNQFLATPCEKIKISTSDAKYKSSITTLEGKTGDGYESGNRLGTAIPGTGQTETQNQVLQNKPGTNQVDMKIFNNTFALMHTHYDGLYPIFSPGDLLLFNQWVVWAKNYNDNPSSSPKIPINNLTLTLVTSNGNYLLAFDGSTIDALPTYTPQQFDAMNKVYVNDYLNQTQTNGNFDMAEVEKQFLKFVSENMNITGLKLYRVKSDGNYEISLTNLQGTKCP
ncbi:hypothetical protein SAMN05880574_11211 [Chryseobacterium sp. RU37D]|uniref:hypothetical protein n=1 Tax=Chryseobacterium sp. RU37D TaxID=1907397 RepID=UPI0009562F6B|nr:hypothetical protein [Chryseobacterium sp. RU37D]SIQ39861.1 hypothetical protein SAMN05880574_11211 [Chryseobacterium sp. RU37D]